MPDLEFTTKVCFNALLVGFDKVCGMKYKNIDYESAESAYYLADIFNIFHVESILGET